MSLLWQHRVTPNLEIIVVDSNVRLCLLPEPDRLIDNGQKNWHLFIYLYVDIIQFHFTLYVFKSTIKVLCIMLYNLECVGLRDDTANENLCFLKTSLGEPVLTRCSGGCV